MTLVLAAHSREAAWVVTDRCLYRGPGQTNHLGIKSMTLDTHDGSGILAYAGLGATARGTQPSQWMANVLRGRGELSFEQALEVLCAAAQRELPPHLIGPASGPHCIVAVGHVQGRGAVTYSIDNIDGGAFRVQRRVNSTNSGRQPTRLVLAGTGGQHLATCIDEWQRQLLSLLKDNDRGRVDDLVVADYLASLNHCTYLAMERRHGQKNTVSPRSIVLWKRSDGVKHGKSGGGVRFYSGRKRDAASPGVPTISRGLDVMAMIHAMLPVWTEAARPFMQNPQPPGTTLPLNLDEKELERRVAALPDQPDERLR